MRIISGKHRGRKIISPKNLPVRPTTDLSKESLFNILNNYFNFEDNKVLDLFSGTGNITYEFASRYCVDITAVDKNYKCFSFIKETVEKLGFENIKVVKSDVFKFLKYCNSKFDIIFADPPYDMEGLKNIPSIIFENNLLEKDGWLIVEHSISMDFSESRNFHDKRNYGQSVFSIFTHINQE